MTWRDKTVGDVKGRLLALFAGLLVTIVVIASACADSDSSQPNTPDADATARLTVSTEQVLTPGNQLVDCVVVLAEDDGVDSNVSVGVWCAVVP